MSKYVNTQYDNETKKFEVKINDKDSKKSVADQTKKLLDKKKVK